MSDYDLIQDPLSLPKGRWVVSLSLVLVDVTVLFVAFLGGIGVRRWLLGGGVSWEMYLRLWPFLGLFLVYFALLGLYPGTGIRAPMEIRKVVYGLTTGFVTLASIAFLTKRAELYSRGAFLLSFGIAVLLLPVARLVARAFFSRFSWWGEGVVVLGAGETGRMVVNALQRESGLGYRVVALLDDDSRLWGKKVFGIPVEGPLSLSPEYAARGVRYLVLAMPGVPAKRLVEILESYGATFPHMIMIPDFFGGPSLWVHANDLGGVLGLEVEQKLLRREALWVKRMLDWGLLLLTIPVWVPLMMVGAVLVKLSSPGPVFFWQERLGVNGRRIRVCKFRTMYVNAEERLQEILAEDPQLRLEYEQYHKLREDPRVPSLGKFLRKWSLDELPQIWNVFKGEMSLVGPRAYMPNELEDMGDLAPIILKVWPGITGLWQVSGRNRLSFRERLRLDVYYVRNWSIWFDLYILLKTIKIVLLGEGAY
ncbi:MAG: undecaprenyl-phosphate galactose phosphotransferase WbaP [Gammaproteobacteria bacterium]|nr:undecaprenyl-phosphate galactose phosphotransferase WbaP [Gammaproteobacteria bacterium]